MIAGSGKMKLYTPTKQEAATLAQNPAVIGGIAIADGALPPCSLFVRAAASDASSWLMPRLFLDDGLGKVIGSGGFKGEPVSGSVEIGYNVAPEFCGNGYCTEGVRRICADAFSNGSVSEVIAETLTSNLASKRVLGKAGFALFDSRIDDEGKFQRWRLKYTPNQARGSAQ
jgi:RimJ/RimL family protein N-acetyltransferase